MCSEEENGEKPSASGPEENADATLKGGEPVGEETQ